MLMLWAHLYADWKPGPAGSTLAVACTETGSHEAGKSCDDRTDCTVVARGIPCSCNNPS